MEKRNGGEKRKEGWNRDVEEKAESEEGNKEVGERAKRRESTWR